MSLKMRVELEYDTESGAATVTPLEGYDHQCERWIPWDDLHESSGLSTKEMLRSAFFDHDGLLRGYSFECKETDIEKEKRIIYPPFIPLGGLIGGVLGCIGNLFAKPKGNGGQ